MASNRNVRNRLGWSSEERISRANNSNRDQSNREIVSLVIPVLVYGKKINTKINTLGQFSKISQELASYAIIKGAVFRQEVWVYNEIRKRVDTIFVPISTNRGSVTKVKFLVDKDLKGSTMILGLPGMRKVGHRVVVGNIPARVHVRPVRQNNEELVQFRDGPSTRYEPPRRPRNSGNHRRESSRRSQRYARDHRERTTSQREQRRRRRQSEEDGDVVEGLSREEMEEIEGLN